MLAENTDDIAGFLQTLRHEILKAQPDIFIFDNLTTSAFYDMKKNGAELAMGLKDLCSRAMRQIPYIVVAHTASGVRQNDFFDSSNVRGFRTITNVAEYVYCLMRFKIIDVGYSRDITVLYTDKSRLHSEASRAFYRLFYDGQSRLFTGDDRISYETFKQFLRGA